MTVIAMKASFQRLQPRIINYKDYKCFQNNLFRKELLCKFLDVSIDESEEGFSILCDICKKILNYHVLCKQKYAWGNHLPLINKTLSKEIMKVTKLRNKLLKHRNDHNKRELSKQRNYSVCFIRKSKKVVL